MKTDFGVFSDLASFGIAMGVDEWARSKGEYKGGWRAEGARLTASTVLGAYGMVLGGPLLGIAFSAFAHALGHCVEEDELESARRKRIRRDYKLGVDFISRHCDCGAYPNVRVVDWDRIGDDLYAIVYDCEVCRERKVLVFRGAYARRLYPHR